MAVEAAECRETAEAEWPLRTEVADVEAPDSLLVSLWLWGRYERHIYKSHHTG